MRPGCVLNVTDESIRFEQAVEREMVMHWSKCLGFLFLVLSFRSIDVYTLQSTRESSTHSALRRRLRVCPSQRPRVAIDRLAVGTIGSIRGVNGELAKVFERDRSESVGLKGVMNGLVSSQSSRLWLTR